MKQVKKTEDQQEIAYLDGLVSELRATNQKLLTENKDIHEALTRANDNYTRASVRLDAALYAMVLMQGEIKKTYEKQLSTQTVWKEYKLAT